ncbi:MAG: hypothetical protein V3V99_01780 [candidate division Zixibacteria bacterium]
MLRRKVLAVLLSLSLMVFIRCSDDSPKPVTPEVAIDTITISGITEVQRDDSFRSIDPNDWCYQYPYPNDSVPQTFALYPVFPNPSYQQAMIHFDIPETSITHIYVIDFTQQIIADLLNEEKPPGSYWTVWDHTQIVGGREIAGMYRIIMEADSFLCHGDIKVDSLLGADTKEFTLEVHHLNNNIDIYYDSDYPLAGLMMILIYEGTVSPPNYYIAAREMVKDYNFVDNTLRVFILPPLPSFPDLEIKCLPAGYHRLCTVPYYGDVVVGYADAADTTGIEIIKSRILNYYPD